MSKFFKSSLIFILIFIIWFFLCEFDVFNTYLLPTPKKVIETFFIMLKSGELIKSIIISFRRIAIGFIFAFIISFLISTLSTLKKEYSIYYDGFFNVCRHIPPLSIIPLLIIWLGIGEVPKITIIFLASFFTLLLNTTDGLQNTDIKLIEVGETFNFSKLKIFFRIRLPYALPQILLGVRLAIGYSIRAIVGAEMISSLSGLGYLILDAKEMSRTDKVFVCIFIISIIGLLVDYIFGKICNNIKWSIEKQ